MNLVIFSPSEMREGAGFWSNDLGWTDLENATVFDSPDYTLPMSSGEDARWMEAPRWLGYYDIYYREPDPPACLFPTCLFSCWAEDLTHALEQLRSAYPNSNVISVRSYET